MITKEERNTFVMLHEKLEELGFKSNLQYGSYSCEFHSIVDVHGTVVSCCCSVVSNHEDHRKLENYRKHLVAIIERHNREAA